MFLMNQNEYLSNNGNYLFNSLLKLKIEYVLEYNYSKSEKLINFKSFILLC